MQQISKTALVDMRLDVLVSLEGDVSRSQAAKWIAEGLCQVNGKSQDHSLVMRQVFQLPEQNGHGELLMKGILNKSMNLNMESMQGA